MQIKCKAISNASLKVPMVTHSQAGVMLVTAKTQPLKQTMVNEPIKHQGWFLLLIYQKVNRAVSEATFDNTASIEYLGQSSKESLEMMSNVWKNGATYSRTHLTSVSILFVYAILLF